MSDYSYYDDLGVSPQASRDELKAAYQDRIAALEAAREKKGVSPAQLQGNRQEAARVRAAWNVLADPFQRSRYDERIGSASTNGDVSDHDDDVIDVDDGASSTGEEVQLTGWRKLMAPPPPKKPAAGGGNGKPPPRPLKEPTIPIPPGMRLADSRYARDGAALRLRGAARHLLGRAARRARHHQQRVPDQGRPDRPPQLAPRRAERHRRRQVVGERRRQGDHRGGEQQQQRRPRGRAVRQGVGPERPEVGAERLRRRRRRRPEGRPPGEAQRRRDPETGRQHRRRHSRRGIRLVSRGAGARAALPRAR